MSIPIAVIALLFARMEYRKYGKLSIVGVLLLCAMLIMPNFVLEFATRYEIPSTFLDYTGVIIGVFGLILCGLGMMAFRSFPRVLCQGADILTVSGVYRWSRNPQYVGWLLFLIGFALNDWSLWCLAALMVVAVSLHLLVLIEEEYLRREFGQQYIEFCGKVPRYFPLPKLL